MIKTNSFIRAALAKGLVDDILELDNGWNIQYRGNIVSVRLNGKGGAVIYNKRKGDVVEIKSAHLDNVLHHYIFQSLFGTQTKTGTRDIEFKDVFFVPTKVVKNSVVFEDAVGRKFTVKGSNPKAVLNFYNQAADVNADDCIILLSGFESYFRPEEAPQYQKDDEIELQLLKCSVDVDDYSVVPRSALINDVGQTIVGNFLCSAADKVSQIAFEEDERKVFSSNGVARRNINSSSARIRNPLATKAQVLLSSRGSQKAVEDYINEKYPNGLTVSALEQVMAYEAPALIKSAKVEGKVDYKELFSNYLRNCDTVSFRMDTNKSILCSVNTTGKSTAKFRAIPDVGAIKNALQKEGYLLSELQDGLEFVSTKNAVSAIVNSCKEYTPVVEDMLNLPNFVQKITGNEVTEVLSSYGVDDKKGVFSSLMRISVN